MKVEAFPVNRCFKRFVVNGDAKLGVKIIFHPEIMIAGKVMHGDSTLNDFLQLREEAMETFRDNGAIFKPCIEQIAEDEELVCILFDEFEKGENAIFFLVFFLAGT